MICVICAICGSDRRFQGDSFVASLSDSNVRLKTAGSRHAGFTLVELLVVVVVIGILAALLFPVLGKVRDRAKETICLNHFRQIGVGLKLYQGDNQGRRHPLRRRPCRDRGLHRRGRLRNQLGPVVVVSASVTAAPPA